MMIFKTVSFENQNKTKRAAVNISKILDSFVVITPRNASAGATSDSKNTWMKGL